MAGPRAIDIALDLSRMPALAASVVEPPIPDDILEVMEIAAGSPDVCQVASEATGQPTTALVDSARFYLQQTLLCADADPHRRLGLGPGASREVARRHFRCLLRWLHPDVNNGWDAVYAERVLSAWREVSAQLNIDSSVPGVPATEWPDQVPDDMQRAIPTNVRVPWIRNPTSSRTASQRIRFVARLGAGAIAVAFLVALAVFAWSSSGSCGNIGIC